MKSKKSLLALLILLPLLLTACKVNFITDIEKNGSGTYVQEIGFEGDEASMAGLSAGDDSFCATQNEDLPPGTSVRQETRGEDETWCIYETPFGSLDELRSIYGTTDSQINRLSMEDEVLTYDLSLDMSGDSSATMGADVTWVVTMPGTITETNANEQDGNTLTWTLVGGQVNNIRAVSDVGGFNFSGSTIWYILGGIAVIGLCCLVPLAIGVVVFLLLRKKKQNAPQEPES